jgi:hypothetical protein
MRNEGRARIGLVQSRADGDRHGCEYGDDGLTGQWENENKGGIIRGGHMSLNATSLLHRPAHRLALVGLMLTAFLLASCNQKEAACRDAVKTKFKSPKSYRTISIKEEDGEGAAFTVYRIRYSYEKSNHVLRGEESCIYDNNEEKAYADVSDPQF